ncbi:amino acid ABC transporter permease [Pelagibaculum spongiae]|nr:amino acid ABC transporter permease [Pelagibaculum spongiae]
MFKSNTPRVRQMERQPNNWLWHGIFVAVVIASCYGFFKSAQSIDYTWRWERLPQYILYNANQDLNAEFDGNIVEQNGQLVLQSEIDPDQIQPIENVEVISVDNGDLIFEGDALGYTQSWQAGPILQGVGVTLELSLYAGVLAIVIGTLTGLAKISPNPALRDFAGLYIEIIRGTPLLVQIFIVYFFIGTVLDLERFTAGVIALSVFTGAYVAEIVRSGIEAINKGQMEAGRSLGLTYGQTMKDIILPQAFKQVLPPLAGQFINLIKDSSLVSVISITDLTKAGREVVSSTFSPFEVWICVAIMYFLLTSCLSFVVRRLEKKYAVSR